MAVETEQELQEAGQEELLSVLQDIRKECAAQSQVLKKQVRFARVTALFCACVAAVAVWGALRLLPRVDSTLRQAGVVLQNLEAATDTINQADIGGMLENMDGLVTQSRTGLTDALAEMQAALAKVNEIDIDKLNNAISDLADVVKPLASLFNR